jgi:hypothetical protein
MSSQWNLAKKMYYERKAQGNTTADNVTSFADLDPYIFLRIRIHSCGCPGSGFVSYSNGIKKFKGRENLTKNTFCVGSIGPTSKENQVKVCKTYCFRYITCLKQ